MTDDNISPSLRSRQQQANMASDGSKTNTYLSSSFSDSGSPSRPTTSTSSSYPPPSSKRTSPFLPTPLETFVLLAYPTLLVFGTLFSVLSPQTRASPYDPSGRAHVPAAAPSYFARKDNVFNIFFVKRGWAWITVAFATFVATHPALGFGFGSRGNAARRVRAGVRWALITAWWVLVTQWCFGPALIDRGFRFTGGKCEVAREVVLSKESAAGASAAEVFTAAACKAAGGRWSGGHDISGHVFLLVLGSFFLLQEVGWVVYRAGFAGGREERSVVMPDGAAKGASVESESSSSAGPVPDEEELGFGGRFAVGVVALCLWMLLMTAIYFHTWFEKLTGLLVAAMGIYPVYFLPRWIPGLRALVGLPGI
ncbi:inositol phospholipid synthesis and fat-storage-inducing TM-domain-containing protein [Daldinia caldariorum]|uniref:inositol phospholipid synthesis and fat-storage-inducing TM-domain-containing protein n=1 Tax=Daldinia caldariorum TaxID=326644 RepID=UPI0020089019|nr:inositol phospholipid synthesis and fat-storage-inducing TM-domain-containing protein [Daldinia caldariorum]KAI1467048.1 inositol phospholipid synthesis and fat-storage-inducing TM-domain-containing protein [Daldinia caldariorum]